MVRREKGAARKVVADNRRARFDYDIGEVFEAGIALKGTEGEGPAHRQATIHESYAGGKNGELLALQFLCAGISGSQPLQPRAAPPRKLLMHKRQIPSSPWQWSARA